MERPPEHQVAVGETMKKWIAILALMSGCGSEYPGPEQPTVGQWPVAGQCVNEFLGWEYGCQATMSFCTMANGDHCRFFHVCGQTRWVECD